MEAEALNGHKGKGKLGEHCYVRFALKFVMEVAMRLQALGAGGAEVTFGP